MNKVQKLPQTDIKQAVDELQAYISTHGLTISQLAAELSIPTSTVSKWFRSGRSRTQPSQKHLKKITFFLDGKKETKKNAEARWAAICDWWETQHKYSSFSQLAEDAGYDADQLSSYINGRITPPRLVVEKVSRLAGMEYTAEDILKNTTERAEKIKQLLLLLESELRWFRDGPPAARQIFRNNLDPYDVGYIASLLVMLENEQKFQRWLTLTTNRFRFFRGRD